MINLRNDILKKSDEPIVNTNNKQSVSNFRINESLTVL